MSGTSDNMLLLQTLQQIGESEAAVQAALLRLEPAFTRHEWLFAENEQWFSRIDQRFSNADKHLDGVEAGIRAMTDRFKSVITLELGKQARLLETQAARRSQCPPHSGPGGPRSCPGAGHGLEAAFPQAGRARP